MWLYNSTRDFRFIYLKIFIIQFQLIICQFTTRSMLTTLDSNYNYFSWNIDNYYQETTPTIEILKTYTRAYKKLRKRRGWVDEHFIRQRFHHLAPFHPTKISHRFKEQRNSYSKARNGQRPKEREGERGLITKDIFQTKRVQERVSARPSRHRVHPRFNSIRVNWRLLTNATPLPWPLRHFHPPPPPPSPQAVRSRPFLGDSRIAAAASQFANAENPLRMARSHRRISPLRPLEYE